MLPLANGGRRGKSRGGRGVISPQIWDSIFGKMCPNHAISEGRICDLHNSIRLILSCICSRWQPTHLIQVINNWQCSVLSSQKFIWWWFSCFLDITTLNSNTCKGKIRSVAVREAGAVCLNPGIPVLGNKECSCWGQSLSRMAALLCQLPSHLQRTEALPVSQVLSFKHSCFMRPT